MTEMRTAPSTDLREAGQAGADVRRDAELAVSVRHFTIDCDGETLTCAEAVPPARHLPSPSLSPSEPLAAVVLHGAGNGDKQSPTVLATHLAARGHHGLAFDFSGHGASTGRLSELSLERRFEQARTVVDSQLPTDRRLLLIGFSMSGQTVADLAAHYGPRVAAIGLGAPAVYAAEAWPVPFGAGFTGIIRTPESWRTSPALDTFRGLPAAVRAVLATPAVDEVIPPAVTEAVDEALTGSDAQYTRLVLPAADHRMSIWFAGDGTSRGDFLDALLGAGDARP
ncbi:alpha/beta hydrolase family protein [Streptomyces sp. NPDC048442]|uniref:alpha/beta hydrolase n=1 Tax=Streptomyces sp. NPDC048442 TaxID=3154823 RepID=UPI00343319E8